MPRLLNLIPCEKIIVDKQDMPTLICLFQAISGEVPKSDTPLPLSTLAIKEWAVFTEWKPDEADTGKTFQHILEVRLPDGSTSPIKSTTPIKIINTQGHRVFINIVGFPIFQEGKAQIRVWLEDGEKPVTEVSEYDLLVSHVRPSAATPT